MGERLGRYELIRPLASGGMGEIFLAEHTGIAGFAKRVALKRIRPDLAEEPHYVELFLNEARLGSFLNHPNIVHIFDVGHEGHALWIVMEYVDGVDLKRLARRAARSGTPLSPVLVAGIAIEVLSALDEAHHGGPCLGAPIIHRDMSPENILIARSGAVKVLDFGLAKWVPAQSAVPSTEGKLIFGKVRYMPPEQLKGQLIDPRADLFALGVVMYEALAGQLPFGHGDASEVLREIRSGRPPPPTRGHDREIEAIVSRAIEPALEDRFDSAESMRKDLVRYLERSADSIPSETLRSMLRARPSASAAPRAGSEAAPHAGPLPAAEAPTHPAEPAPAEIGLGTAERCGKCGGRFRALFLDGLIVERCESCRGLWLESDEIERFVGAANRARDSHPKDGFTRAPLDAIVGSCPICRVGLSAFRVPEQPALFELCTHCGGLWLDPGEIDLLRDPRIAGWMRRVVDSLEA